MEGIVKQLLEVVLGSGGNQGVVAILMLVSVSVVFLAFKRDQEYKKERDKLVEQFQKQIDEERHDLLQVIDKYQAGQISVIQALSELKLIIATIGAKL